MQTEMTVYNDHAETLAHTADWHDIQSQLETLGVIFERWDCPADLAADADQETVLAAYATEIEQLNQRFGFVSIDVASLQPDNPKKDEFRQMFLSEHRHADFEVRFFVDGQGLFFLRPQDAAPDRVFAVRCTRGDLISVPAGMTHWFDMGDKPFFKAIRFFTTDNGWVGDFTGDNIAQRFPLFES